MFLKKTCFRKISSSVRWVGSERTSGYYFTNQSKVDIPGGPALRWWQAKSEKRQNRKE